MTAVFLVMPKETDLFLRRSQIRFLCVPKCFIDFRTGLANTSCGLGNSNLPSIAYYMRKTEMSIYSASKTRDIDK